MRPLRSREAVAVPIASLPRTSPRYHPAVRESFCVARKTCKQCSAVSNSCVVGPLAIGCFLSSDLRLFVPLPRKVGFEVGFGYVGHDLPATGRWLTEAAC